MGNQISDTVPLHFTESGLHFEFSGDWMVRKYDAHRYYRPLSGIGLKGVDFIGILDWQTLVLFEIKNYSTRISATLGRPVPVEPKPPEELAEVMKLKVEDTLQALRAIRVFYRRNWLYRVFLPLIRYRRRLFPEPAFWTRAFELAGRLETVQAVLWGEFDDNPPDGFFPALLPAISGYQPPIALASRKEHPYSDRIRVEQAGPVSVK
ncbi:MAG TPA: hypothetical protein PKE06_01495 [Flavilitoribacter sp.]|nr:hypothetical protein [Flavilitoribacter sp.]